MSDVDLTLLLNNKKEAYEAAVRFCKKNKINAFLKPEFSFEQLIESVCFSALPSVSVRKPEEKAIDKSNDREPKAIAAARKLSEFLSVPKSVKETKEWATAEGITPATLRVAKEKNGHDTEKRAEGYYWLPINAETPWTKSHEEKMNFASERLDRFLSEPQSIDFIQEFASENGFLDVLSDARFKNEHEAKFIDGSLHWMPSDKKYSFGTVSHKDKRRAALEKFLLKASYKEALSLRLWGGNFPTWSSYLPGKKHAYISSIDLFIELKQSEILEAIKVLEPIVEDDCARERHDGSEFDLVFLQDELNLMEVMERK